MKTVLCIEDDRFIGEMYVRSLEKAGFTVDWMIDGDDGLVAAKNKQYDFILVDLMLPNRKGTEILQALRGEQNLVQKSKVIILTNYQQSAYDRVETEKLADGYYIKTDLTPRKLVEILNKMS
ncbi:response regulator [Candidatus Saccharibacteria bacterium]|nr:response regulator [Candidatus Saccharibacteria bacterium]